MWNYLVHKLKTLSCTLCSSRTRAFVGVDKINAGTTILAGLRLAFIDLFGAVNTMVTRDTLRNAKT